MVWIQPLNTCGLEVASAVTPGDGSGRWSTDPISALCRGAVHRAEVRASSCEAQESRLQFCLIEAQAEVANSRSRLAEISDSHSAELAARAQMAAQQDSTLSDERAAKAKLSAQVSELKASLVSMEVCA